MSVKHHISPYLYRARNLVERFFNKIKQYRRIATRYDKLAANYLAFIKLASIRIWLRAYESTSSEVISCRASNLHLLKHQGSAPRRRNCVAEIASILSSRTIRSTI